MMMRDRIAVLVALASVVVGAIEVGMGAATRPPATAPAAAPSGPPAGIVRVKLWEKTPGVVEGVEKEADPTEPTLDIYLPPEGKGTGVGMVVLPGGSYSNLAVAKEGTGMAQWLLAHNIAAFVLRYRHAPRYHHPVPLMDVQRALRTVRAKAAEYHLVEGKIGVVGFSAGGHLAASAATMFNDGPVAAEPDAIDKVSARPDFAVLMYPVIDMSDEAVVHKNSRTALTNGDEKLYAVLSMENRVTKDVPPVFLAAGTNDKTVPVMNSVLFYEACVKAGVPAELHIFENGPHGFGLGGTDASLSAWPEMMVHWLERNKVLVAK